MRRYRRTAVLLIGLALTGCASTTQPAGAASPSGPSAAPSQPPAGTPTPTPPVSAPPSSYKPVPGTLIQYGRQGGFAGFNDQLTIAPDGTYDISRRGRAPQHGRLSAKELADLRAVLDSAHFADIPATNPAPGVIADGFTYRVAYAGHEVLTETGGEPPALQKVLSALQNVIALHGGS
jgi:hypothetical protein